MGMKDLVKQFVPPILLSGLRIFRKKQRIGVNVAIGHQKPKLSDSLYQIDFKHIDAGSEVHFVPIYAVHRPACQEVLAGRYYEPLTHALIGALLNDKPGNMIHAGTFFGDMLPSFSRKCSGTVYAFEPVLENYVLSKICIQQNNLENVIIFNAGLGKEMRVARIDTGDETSQHRGGRSHIGDAGQLTSLVAIDRLGLNSVSIIQLDVEGSELNALEGAVQTIETCRPAVLIEDNANNCAPLLKGLEYVQVGSIPGLAVWTDNQHASHVKDILQRL